MFTSENALIMTIKREYRQCARSCPLPGSWEASTKSGCCVCVWGVVSPRAPQDGKQSFPQMLALGGQISVHSARQTEPWEWRLRRAQGGTRDISACRCRCVLMEKTTWFHRHQMTMLEVPQYKHKNTHYGQDLKLWLNLFPISFSSYETFGGLHNISIPLFSHLWNRCNHSTYYMEHFKD